MLCKDLGIVVALGAKRNRAREVFVLVAGKVQRALNYELFTGRVLPGHQVVLNTTADFLGLGTGGYHYIIHVIGHEKVEINKPGHIMKLRYTPLQFACLAVEEQDSPYHQVMAQAEKLRSLLPIVCGSLHSILPAVAAAIKRTTKGQAKIVYLMTDGAALPIELSKLVFRLRENNLLDGTITIGHAFGGDLEAVNLYSGLLAADHVLGADVMIVAMGPGIVGTGTKFGSTGIELGEIINAISILGGQPIVVPRLNFADCRARHQGVSHHSLTALGRIALRPAIIALPLLRRQLYDRIRAQLKSAGVWGQHKIMMVDGAVSIEILEERNIELTTMGRGFEEEEYYFLAAAAAGVIAGEFYNVHAKEVHPKLDNAD